MEYTINLAEYDELMPYQKEKLCREIEDFRNLNKVSRQYMLKTCPKCGSTHPNFTKAGFANSGKQMVFCHDCHKRSVVDHGQLTYYSHQAQSKWDQLMEDTLQQVSEEETAAKLDVSTYTVWRMRMKFTHSLQKLQENNVLSDEIELDEKYVQNSHKGKKIEGVKSRHRGEPASKRGLSDEQVCIVTGVQRLGDAVLLAANCGNPGSEDIMKIQNSIADRSLIWTDGKTSYNQLINTKKCDCRVVGDHTTYTSVDHLNNVNSFHSMIEEWYRVYRGVASKYLNRYCALFTIVRHYQGCDIQEIMLDLTRRLRQISDFFRIADMKTKDLFVCQTV